MNGSTLTIHSVSVWQSGNYTCLPSNMRPDSVIVTIQAENKSGGLALQVKFKYRNQESCSSYGLLPFKRVKALKIYLPIFSFLVLA